MPTGPLGQVHAAVPSWERLYDQDQSLYASSRQLQGHRSDLNRDTLWPVLVEYGMRPVSQVAVDEVWSAPRFRPLKPDEPPFTGGRG